MLAKAAVDGAPDQWEQGRAFLLGLDGRRWLILDDVARRFSYLEDSTPVAGARGWLGPSASEATGFVAAVTSLHVDGRIRQRAVQILAGRPGAVPAAGLAVRCLDHVVQVREDAALGLQSQAAAGFLEPAFDVLLAGRRRRHAEEALSAVLEVAIAVETVDAVVQRFRRHPSRRLQVFALELGDAQEVLSVAELVTTMTTNPDQGVRAACLPILARRASNGQLRPLLSSRYVDARVLAVSRLGDEDLPDGLLLPMLADRSARVREVARWRARRRGLDVAAWYRQRLGVEPVTAGVGGLTGLLLGLAAVATLSDADVFAAFLQDPRPRVRAAAVAGFAAVAGSQEVWRRLGPVLTDSSPRVTTAVAISLARVEAGALAADLLARVWLHEQPWSRRAAWRLARARGAWDRVEADLRATTDADPRLRELGDSGIRNWLEASAATTWGGPDDAQRERLAAYLETSLLPFELRRAVAFHAGIRPLPVSAPAHGGWSEAAVPGDSLNEPALPHEDALGAGVRSRRGLRLLPRVLRRDTPGTGPGETTPRQPR